MDRMNELLKDLLHVQQTLKGLKKREKELIEVIKKAYDNFEKYQVGTFCLGFMPIDAQVVIIPVNKSITWGEIPRELQEFMEFYPNFSRSFLSDVIKRANNHDVNIDIEDIEFIRNGKRVQAIDAVHIKHGKRVK